eukprot:scaffold176319_cov17-Tisochrysis_lutea.AAC.2
MSTWRAVACNRSQCTCFACREVIGSRHAGWLDWERVVDFSHGSFRLMGSHKPKHIQRVSESMGKMMESIPLSGRHRRAAATGTMGTQGA